MAPYQCSKWGKTFSSNDFFTFCRVNICRLFGCEGDWKFKTNLWTRERVFLFRSAHQQRREAEMELGFRFSLLYPGNHVMRSFAEFLLYIFFCFRLYAGWKVFTECQRKRGEERGNKRVCTGRDTVYAGAPSPWKTRDAGSLNTRYLHEQRKKVRGKEKRRELFYSTLFRGEIKVERRGNS